MGTISVSLPADGQTIDAADYNVPINTIVAEINGNLGTDNIENGAIINAKLNTAAGELGGAYTTYVPALTASTTNPTLGTASAQTGFYTTVGKNVRGFGQIKFGTSGTAAGTGTYYVSLPVAASANQNPLTPVGYVYMRDNSSASKIVGLLIYTTTTTAAIAPINSTTNHGNVTEASPWAWAASDTIDFSFDYEKA